MQLFNKLLIKIWFKRIAILVCILLFILILTVSSILIFVNPNSFKPYIAKLAYRATGRELTIHGNMSFKYYNYNIALHLENIALSNPKKLNTIPNMLTLNSMDVSLRFMPLLRGVIAIDDCVLDGLNLLLIKKNELNNWTFEPIEPTPQKQPSLKSFELHNLKLLNSKIGYKDLTSKNLILSKTFNLHLTTNSQGRVYYKTRPQTLELKDVNLNLDSTLQAKLNLIMNNHCELNYSGVGEFYLNSLRALLSKTNLNISKKLLAKDLNNLKVQISLNKNSNILNINKLIVASSKINLNGALNATIQNNSVKIVNNFNIQMDELSNFLPLKGYKVYLNSLNLNGYFNFPQIKNLTSFDGVQKVTISKVILRGISAKQVADKISHSVEDMSFIKRMFKRWRAHTVVKAIKEAVEGIQKAKTKDLSLKTDIGKVEGIIVFQSPKTLFIPEFKALSNEVSINSGGVINLNDKFLNYYFLLHVETYPPDGLVNNIWLPYDITGKLKNPSSGVNWKNLLKEVLDFYANH